MEHKEEIENVFRQYLKAIYSNDFTLMYSVLYEDDVKGFRNLMIDFAYKMDDFGENQDFIDNLGIKSIQQLESLSLLDFMSAIFKLISRDIGQERLNKVIDEVTITSIKETDGISHVSYEYPIFLFDAWELNKGKVKMVQSLGEWKILLNSGLKAGFCKFQEEIDLYYDRKKRDNLKNFKFEGDLTTFSIVGYKDFSSGKVVLEPRFKDAGDFSHGLAYVKIMRKYGYINTKGDIVIKPQFVEAKDFSQSLAAVCVKNAEGQNHWGFINKKGIEKIPFQYEETSNFSQGLCAVRKNEKWGFIDKKGGLVIPFKYDVVEDFDQSTAYVSIYNEEGEEVSFEIDKKGQVK